MKKLIASTLILLAVSAIFLITPAKAGPPVASSIRQTIAESVPFPETVAGLEALETVELLFSVGKDGKIEIQNLKSSNDGLKTYVEEKLSTIRLKEVGTPDDGLYKIAFTFKQP